MELALNSQMMQLIVFQGTVYAASVFFLLLLFFFEVVCLHYSDNKGSEQDA